MSDGSSHSPAGPEPGELVEPDSEIPFDLWEVDEDVEPLQDRGPTLGALAQLVAALVIVVVLGLVIVGAGAALSWLFR